VLRCMHTSQLPKLRILIDLMIGIFSSGSCRRQTLLLVASLAALPCVVVLRVCCRRLCATSERCQARRHSCGGHDDGSNKRKRLRLRLRLRLQVQVIAVDATMVSVPTPTLAPEPARAPISAAPCAPPLHRIQTLPQGKGVFTIGNRARRGSCLPST